MFPAVGVGTVLCSGGAWKKYSCDRKRKNTIENRDIFNKKSSFLWTCGNARLSVLGINTVYCKSLLSFSLFQEILSIAITRSLLPWHETYHTKPKKILWASRNLKLNTPNSKLQTRASKLDSRFSKALRIEDRVSSRDCQLTFDRYCIIMQMP